MVWASHRAVTFVTLLVATSDFSAAFTGMLGSTLPDRIEGPFWHKWHRTYSHWFVLYLPALVVLAPIGAWMMPANAFSVGITEGILSSLFWAVTGALLHIAEDAVCGRIPVCSPTKKITVFPRLFYVGSKAESVFVFLYCAVLLVVGVMNR